MYITKITHMQHMLVWIYIYILPDGNYNILCFVLFIIIILLYIIIYTTTENIIVIIRIILFHIYYCHIIAS
jgi:hypothetical protein